MRTFEERKAEIVRRSEKRIKERRRNRRLLLMSGIPLLVGMSVLSLVIPAKELPSKGSEDIAEVESDASTRGDFYGSVEVSSNKGNQYVYYDSEQEVERVKTVFLEITGVEDGTDVIGSVDNGSKTENHSTDLLGGNATGSTGLMFSIIITNEEGKAETYSLLNNVLIDRETNKEYLLTESQCEQVKSALGISQE